MSSAAAERENRALESATESIIMRLADIKTSLAGLITKLETDPHLNWHSFLDSYALISGQLNSLLKNVKSERTPILKRYISIPILLSPEPDDLLSKLTDNRVGAFSHDLVPHYLRTKPDPEVEARHAGYVQRAGTPSPEVISKMLTVFEKITRETLKIITRERDELEQKTLAARNENDNSTHTDDTHNLIASVWYGKNLRPEMPIGGMIHARPTEQQQQQMMQQQQHQQMSKAPSMIRTTIKAARQVHPFPPNDAFYRRLQNKN